MVYEDKSAVYALNSYLWKLLEANLEWDMADYDGGRPIIPTAQMPEFMQSGKPFIVYGSSVKPPKHLYALRTQAVAYRIYAGQSLDVNKIVSLLVKAFERQDEAAADVNSWLKTENKGRNITFGSVSLSLSEEAEPATDEGGFVEGVVILEITYTENNNNIVTSGFTV